MPFFDVSGSKGVREGDFLPFFAEELKPNGLRQPARAKKVERLAISGRDTFSGSAMMRGINP